VGTAAFGRPPSEASVVLVECLAGLDYAAAQQVLDGRKPSEEIWLSVSPGLRGSFRALSGARKQGLVALETWLAGSEKEKD